MAFIHVCRHGQDMDNAEGLLNGHRNRPLTPQGEQQAQHVAARICEQGVTYAAIYASPLQRAHQTATTIAAALHMPVVTMDALIERDFGVLSGRPYADIPKYAGENIYQGDNVLYFLKVEGGESFDECYGRAQGVLHTMDEKHPGEHVLLVCHGDIGKMLQAARKGVPWQKGLELPFIANTDVIEL